jgi:hypothetical protein
MAIKTCYITEQGAGMATGWKTEKSEFESQ